MNCAGCDKPITAESEAIVFKGEEGCGGPAFKSVRACLWLGPTEPRVVARGFCMYCAAREATNYAACTRCGATIGPSDEVWKAHVIDGDLFHYREGVFGAGVVVDRGLCTGCVRESSEAAREVRRRRVANVTAADALRCGLTVPFQATAGEASP